MGHAKEMAPLQIEKMLKQLGLDEFVSKVRPYKDEKSSNRKPKRQSVRGSQEAKAKSLSDRLSYKEQQDRKKKHRQRQKEQREQTGKISKPRKKSRHSSKPQSSKKR